MKSKTCYFSGYRPDYFNFPLNSLSPEYNRLLGFINIYIIYSIEQGFSEFLCGMAQGFDMLCGETILRLKKHPDFSHIRLTAVLPYPGHGKSWNAHWRGRHENIKAHADAVVCTCSVYTYDCFQAQNKFMTDRSGRLITFYDSESNAAAYCRKRKIEVINLADKLTAVRK